MAAFTPVLPAYPLVSGRARRWTLDPLNARELFEALTALPAARAVSSPTASIASSLVLGGVEIGHAEVVDEGPLRRAWRERANRGPTPLLLLVDDPERDATLRALGPLAAEGPIRAVGSAEMLAVLSRLPSLSSLHAVRELAEELDRLDRTGIAGVTVNGLGTHHLFAERLRQTAAWVELASLAEPAHGEWGEVLRALGFALERRRTRGWLARYEGRPIAVVWPRDDPTAFSKLDRDGRPPEGVLLNDCREEGVPYGLLVSGARLRLFEADPVTGSAAARYLELDAAALAPEDRPLLGLLSPTYLAEGRFAALMEDSRSFGVALRERVDRAIRERVLPVLGLELGRWGLGEGWDLADDERRGELEAAALTFVFRALFLLYAESAGHVPTAHESYRPHSLSRIVRDAHERADELGARSTTLWRRIGTLVEAMRTGDPAMAVPAYNGALFAPDGFDGAETLERAAIPDRALGPALAALGIDPETDAGVDFSGLAIGHLGHIYEGLLSLRLSIADTDYAYDARRDRYSPVEPDEAEVRRGELLWLTNEGGRKGGGVYYTPEALVRHLVRRAVVPAFAEHLEGVSDLAREDPAAAGRRLFDFRVLDPACGSAHFLVVVVDELADAVARFLGETPLPAVQRELDELRAGAGATYGVGVEDVALLRRLVLKRCVYGVDLSRMGAEIAKVSLWLASFVPGLSLSYLDHNVRVGNSLIGVADLGQVREPGEEAGQLAGFGQLVRAAASHGAEAAVGLLKVVDRTPDEVAESAAAERETRKRVAGARRLLDLWVAEPLGLGGARIELWRNADAIAGDYGGTVSDESEERVEGLVDRAEALAERHRVLHWPLDFPEVFAREAGGFDAVVGNPPWEEVTVEASSFYAFYRPGIRRGVTEAERAAAIAELLTQRPELAHVLTRQQQDSEHQRRYVATSEYSRMAGDPDLYKYFCQRYRNLLRPDGALGVVLPRTAFVNQGSAGFRRWLFEETSCERIDVLRNRRQWAFPTHSQFTVASLVARDSKPSANHRVEVAGTAESLSAWIAQTSEAGIRLAAEAFGSSWAPPLVRNQLEADVLARLRGGTDFPWGVDGRWQCFPVRELEDTPQNRRLWYDAPGGWPLWKGESFGQYDPHGRGAALCPPSEEVLRKAEKPRPGGESTLAGKLPLQARRHAMNAERLGTRIAFNDVSQRSNPRSVIACLIPARTFLLNSAPYLVFAAGSDEERAACLGILNSLPFDWQARRFMEIHLNYFILEGLQLPPLDDDATSRIAGAAARLSCVDERFAAFAESVGVEHGSLDPEERESLLVEVDALVARAWGLGADDLDVIYADFTFGAVPPDYRERLHTRLEELTLDPEPRAAPPVGYRP